MVLRKDLPQLNELILCTSTRITPFAAWVRLDEYQDLEGMIHISEVAGRCVRDIRDFVKPNRQYVAKVIRIDTQKNLVELSLKKVMRYEEKEKINSFRKEQRSEKILEQVGRGMDKTLEQAYEEIGISLMEKFGELSTAFEEIHKDKTILEKLGVDKKWSDALTVILQKSFKERKVSLRAELELKGYSGDGVEKIKNILSGIEKNGLVVRYISAPLYRVELESSDPKAGDRKLREVLEKVSKDCKSLDVESSYRLTQ